MPGSLLELDMNDCYISFLLYHFDMNNRIAVQTHSCDSDNTFADIDDLSFWVIISE